MPCFYILKWKQESLLAVCWKENIRLSDLFTWNEFQQPHCLYVYVLFSRLTSFPLPSHNKLKSISTLKTLQRAIKLRNFLQKKISEWYKLKFCFLLFKTLKLIRKLHDRKKYLFKKRNYCMLIAILNHTPFFLFE